MITLSSLAHVYAVSGKRAAAEKLLKELEDSAKNHYIPSYDFAILLAGLGKKDRTLARLEQAYQDGSYWLFTLKSDPRLDSIRSDPRFADLVRRVDLPR